MSDREEWVRGWRAGYEQAARDFQAGLSPSVPSSASVPAVPPGGPGPLWKPRGGPGGSDPDTMCRHRVWGWWDVGRQWKCWECNQAWETEGEAQEAQDRASAGPPSQEP